MVRAPFGSGAEARRRCATLLALCLAGVLSSSAMRRRELLSDVRYVADLDLSALRSRTTVQFDCLSPGAASFANLDVASVESLRFNGERLSPDAWSDGRLDLPHLEASNVLEVTANVTLGDGKARGLVAFSDTGGETFVYTYGRTDGVAKWAPSFLDVPAAWDLRVVVPDEWTVLSHCPPAAATGDGVWRFLPPYPLPDGPTFAAGPWVRADSPTGVPMSSRPSAADVLVRSPVGDFVAAALEHHAQVLDVPYPYETRDCVFIPGYGSQAGCSGGLILCHERVLYASVDEEWLRYVRWVLAHETAHSWFGGLVGFSDVEQRWTAEGLATYLCHRANNSWDRFHVLEELEAQTDDAAGAVEAPSLIYAKPAAVVRHLESVSGTTAVEAGLTSWLREYAGRSSTGDDLVAAWSRAAGLDLSSWARDWLYTPGVNTLSFERTTGTIRQHGTPLREHHLTIQAFDADLTAREPIEIVVTAEETVVPVDITDAELIVLNAPARTFAKIRLDERTRHALAKSFGDLHDDARAACWVAGVQMTRDGLLPVAELRSWIDTFASAEPDPEVRTLLLAAVATP